MFLFSLPILNVGACFPLRLLLIAECLAVGWAFFFFFKANNGVGLCCVFLGGLVRGRQKKGAGVQQSELAAL